MTLYSAFFSLGVGMILGILYGLFFIIPRRRVLSVSNDHQSARRNLLFIAITTIARLMFLALLLTGLLSMPSLNPLIMLLSLMVSFWLVILKHKAFFYGRH